MNKEQCTEHVHSVFTNSNPCTVCGTSGVFTQQPAKGHKCHWNPEHKYEDCPEVQHAKLMSSQQPAVEGWQKKFENEFCYRHFETDELRLYPERHPEAFMDFIRSQITKAKEEERRIILGIIDDYRKEQGIDYDGLFSLESRKKKGNLTDYEYGAYQKTQDIANMIRFRHLLPTGDNKQV